MKVFNENHLANLEAQKRNASAAFIAASELLTEQRGKLDDLKTQLRVNFTERPPREEDFPKEFAVLSKSIADSERKVAAAAKNREEISSRATATNMALRAAQRFISETRLKSSDAVIDADYPRPHITINQFQKAVENVRGDIATAKTRRATVEADHVSEFVALERLNAEVDAIKAALAEFPLDAFVSRHGSTRGAILTLPEQHFAGAPLLSEERILHPYLVGALNIEAARKLYAAKIAEFYKTAGPGFSEVERGENLAKLDAEIRAAEEREEAFIRLGEAEFRLFVDRRTDANPEVLIGPIVEVADIEAPGPDRVVEHHSTESRRGRSVAPPNYKPGVLEAAWSTTQ
jgi:hypothetical protein